MPGPGADRLGRGAGRRRAFRLLWRDAAGNTERPETVEVGANVLAGTGSEKIMDGAMRMLETDTRWENPFGDGHTGDRIVKIVGN